MRPLWPPMYRMEWFWTGIVLAVGSAGGLVLTSPAPTPEELMMVAVGCAGIGIAIHLQPEREPPDVKR